MRSVGTSKPVQANSTDPQEIPRRRTIFGLLFKASRDEVVEFLPSEMGYAQ